MDEATNNDSVTKIDENKKKLPYFCVCGNIAVGKTTLCQDLSDELGFILFPEPFEYNPFLELFYENPKKHGFLTQLSFILLNIKNLFDIDKVKEHGVIQDRCIYEVLIFSHVYSFKNDAYI